jgi:hypothetical protein
MKMPGAPAPMGADGQINVPGPIIEPADGSMTGSSPATTVLPIPVGSQDHGPASPAHGAAGGHDVDFSSVAPDLHTDTSTSTGMTESHPALGGRNATALGV